MISLDLNGVERRRQDANDLSALIAQYLAAGGKIDVPEPAAIKLTSTSERKHPPSFQRPKVRNETTERAARICEMAKMLNRGEICEKEGIALTWNDITEFNEAMHDLILNAHGLGSILSCKAIGSPRNKTQIRESVAWIFQSECLAELKCDPGDEMVLPNHLRLK
ncbi:TPA: hypothetical protein ACKP2V_000189 [Pseudomonas putida]